MKVKSPLLILGAILGECSDHVHTFAGGSVGVYDGFGTNAGMGSPGGFVQTSPTKIWFSDWFTHSIRTIDPYTKEINSVVGSLSGLPGFADGDATTARFLTPCGMVHSDLSQSMYIADRDSHAIRVYDLSSGYVSTAAGSITAGFVDGVGTSVQFLNPIDVTLSDDHSKLYVVDRYTVRQISLSSGQVTRIAGYSFSGTADGIGTNAGFQKLEGIVSDGDYLYVVDRVGCLIRRIQISTKNVISFSGKADECQENKPGIGTEARFYEPSGISLGANGDASVLYVSSMSAISKIVVSTGMLTIIAGSKDSPGYADGLASSARFSNIHSTFMSSAGRIFVGEASSRIRTFEFNSFTLAPTFIYLPTGNPTSLSPVTTQPITMNPGTSSPATSSPTAFPSNWPTMTPSTQSPETMAPLAALTSHPTMIPSCSPSTISPLTNTPTTHQPATQHPVSIHPISQSPYTFNPLSSSPTSYHPATAHPGSSHPITNTPFTSSPMTSSPTSYHPISLKPSSHPVTNSPITSSPSVSPASSHPTTQHPLSAHPATSAPVTSSPITLWPTSCQPATPHPSSHPVTGFPFTSNPITVSPASSHPVTLHPGSSHPATNSPETSNPVTSFPVSSHPATDHPGSSHPASNSPVTSSPSTWSPTSFHPATLQPTTSHPASNFPVSIGPLTASPASSHPATLHPGSSHPASNSPLTLGPLTASPASSYPSTHHPGSSHPASNSPSTVIPLTGSPASSHPITQHPGSSHPASSSPLTSSPLTSSPASFHPATLHPGSSHPASNCPVSLSPISASPASFHPVTQHPGSSHPTLAPVTLSPSSSHPGSTHPVTAGSSEAPGAGPSSGPIGFPVLGASAPILSLSAPKEVGICGILRIETSVQSIGSVYLNWFLNSHPIVSFQDALVLSYGELQMLATSSGIGNLVDGTILNFTALALDQSTGLFSSIQQAMVTHRGIMQPSLIISGPSLSTSVHPSEPLRLSVTAQHVSCLSITASDLGSMSFQYSWDITSGGHSLGLALDNSPEIIVPSGSLLPSRTHKVIFTLSGISSLYPGISSVQTSLTLTAADVPVVAVLSTGAMANVPSGTEVSIDGSKSTDPANLSHATRSFSWSCTTPSPYPTSCTSSLTPSTTGEITLLSPGSLTPGAVLTISLTFTVSANFGASIGTITRSSTSSTIITGVARAPLVSLAHQTSKTVMTPGLLPAGSALRLSSSVTPDPSTSLPASQLIYSWNEDSGLLEGLSAYQRLSELEAPVLVLAAGSLSPGMSYVFTLSVSDPTTDAGAGQATVSISVLSSPIVTSILSSPMSGVVRETTFRFLAHATVADFSQVPLYYQFLIRVGGRQTVVGNTQIENTKNVILDQYGTLEVGVEVRDSFGSMANLWGSETIDVQATSAFQDPCTALNMTKTYLLSLLRTAGFQASAEEACIGDDVFFYLDLLSLLQARSAVFAASNYILSFLGSFPSNITNPCISCTSHSTYSTYKSALFIHLISSLQPCSSRAYTSPTAQSLYALASSPLTTNANAGSQSALVANFLGLWPELSTSSISGSRTSALIADALSFLALARDKSAGDLTRKLLVGVSRDMIPGEIAAELTTLAFDAHVQALALETASERATVSSGVNVTVPSGLAANASDVRLLVVSWKPGLPADAPKVQEGESLVSDVEDVTLTNSNGNNIIIPEGENIRIAISLKEGETTDGDLRCVYIENSGSRWSEDGCYLDVQGSSVVCVCTHLTEFAVMRRTKDGQRLPERLRWSYLCGAGIAWMIAVCALVQGVRLWIAKAHRGWIALAHYLLMCQGLFRALSSVMYSGIVVGFRVQHSHAAAVVVVTALPYTFSFWTASVIAFQWMASAFNSKLKTDNFHGNRFKYYISNVVVVVIIWVFIIAMWVLDMEVISYVGPIMMAFFCLLLVILYLVGGFTISHKLKKSFSIMTVSLSSEKVQKQMKNAKEVRMKAIVNAGCFGAISIIWILSAVFRDDPQALQILIPSFLFFDSFGGCLILFMYAKSVRQKSKGSFSVCNVRWSNSSRFASKKTSVRQYIRPRVPISGQQSLTWAIHESKRDMCKNSIAKTDRKSNSTINNNRSLTLGASQLPRRMEITPRVLRTITNVTPNLVHMQLTQPNTDRNNFEHRNVEWHNSEFRNSERRQSGCEPRNSDNSSTKAKFAHTFDSPSFTHKEKRASLASSNISGDAEQAADIQDV
ncbi:hypothetical protein AAMO2058_001223700 [Amorphochlora amoebiformis]